MTKEERYQASAQQLLQLVGGKGEHHQCGALCNQTAAGPER